MIPTLESICCFCACKVKNEGTKLLYLREETSCRYLVEYLCNLLDINAEEPDWMTKDVCSLCVFEITSFHDFILRCKQAQSIIHRVYNVSRPPAPRHNAHDSTPHMWGREQNGIQEKRYTNFITPPPMQLNSGWVESPEFKCVPSQTVSVGKTENSLISLSNPANLVSEGVMGFIKKDDCTFPNGGAVSIRVQKTENLLKPEVLSAENVKNERISRTISKVNINNNDHKIRNKSPDKIVASLLNKSSVTISKIEKQEHVNNPVTISKIEKPEQVSNKSTQKVAVTSHRISRSMTKGETSDREQLACSSASEERPLEQDRNNRLQLRNSLDEKSSRAVARSTSASSNSGRVTLKRAVAKKSCSKGSDFRIDTGIKKVTARKSTTKGASPKLPDKGGHAARKRSVGPVAELSSSGEQPQKKKVSFPSGSKTVPTEASKEFVCPYCDKMCKDKYRYNLHLSSHSKLFAESDKKTGPADKVSDKASENVGRKYAFWTAEEKNVIYKYFRNYITGKQPPPKNKAQDCILEYFDTLSKRDAGEVHKYVMKTYFQ